MSPVAAKEHAHQLIEQMAPAQVEAILELLEDLLDPLSVALTNAPDDDEPLTLTERTVIASSAHDGRTTTISTESLLADYGLTPAEFYRLADGSTTN